MRISGFTFARNADKLYYPIEESVRSMLPLVDELVVALGEGDPDDRTRDILQSIDLDKIKIISTTWDMETYQTGTVNAQQTDLAKSHCTGDWLLYLQADEVLHEKDYEQIRSNCVKYFEDERVEGFLFNYLHFWADYKHLVRGHTWYDREIRIIRNRPDIHSWQSAQSFRSMPDFDGRSYRKKEGSRKLRVKQINASVYHYGWVRPPSLMANKIKALAKVHGSIPKVKDHFDYGDLSRYASFEEKHPEVMQNRIEDLNWREQLSKHHTERYAQQQLKHERWKYRALSWVEENLLGGQRVATQKNYEIINN